MASGKDWAAEAADALNEHVCFDAALGGYRVDPEVAAAIIEKHCPFERGVVYMPVPRCDSCKFWRQHQHGGAGSCTGSSPNGRFVVGMTAVAGAPDPGDWHSFFHTAPDFGCVQHEPKET